MDEVTAKLLRPKIEAMRAFIITVGSAWQFLPDNETRSNYRAMYEDIKKTLNDPNLETYAPSLPHLGTTSDDATLRQKHQILILESGTRLIKYIEAQLTQVPSTSRLRTHPLRCFLSYRFSKEGKQYAIEVKHFLELIGVEVVTGEHFEPRGIGEKVRELLSTDLDFGILIIAKTGESMWTRDEVNKLWNEEKYVIVLVIEGASFSPGLQSDLEWIPYTEGHISDTFVHILEGVQFIRGKIELESQVDSSKQTN